METIIMVGQLLLGLSILVGLHEWGHLIAAKTFGMRVEKYSIGFPPKIWGKQIGETEYSIGAIPLGGFVKISGMIDESLDTKSLSEEPEPWEFRAKPAWQRLIVMMGGIIVNVITGIIIFIGLALVNGDAYLPKEELNKHGIVAGNLGEQAGFKTGDRILKVNGEDYERFSDILSPDVILADRSYYEIDRNGEIIQIEIPKNFLDKLSDKSESESVILPRMPFSIGELAKGGPAEEVGLLPGDKILSIAGTEINYFDELKPVLEKNTLETVSIVVDREGEELEKQVNVSNDATLGFFANIDLEYVKESYSFAEATSVGTVDAFGVVWLNIKGFKKMFSGDVDPRKSLSGPIRIAKFFGGTWDWNNFWRIVGLLSMVLAFMNFLPIPALDGGHVMFLTWEMVTGKKPADKFLENAQKVGMIFLLTLMVFIIVNDIIQF